ncbi:MAG: hypothetical protein WA125_16930 [Desulfosporosinus sp.]
MAKATARMTVDEMIRKFWCELAEKDGQQVIRISGKPSKAQMEQLKASKNEIIAELKKREAVKQAREATEKAKLETELEGLKNGTILISPSWHDGEYLMGYEVYGQAAKLLEEIGAAKYVSGWGTHVSEKVIKALGKEFTYQTAVEHMRPAKEAAEAKKAAKEAERQSKFDQARETGKKVLIRSWESDCHDPEEECNFDMNFEYAMPDGSTARTWNHTW